MLPPPPSNVHDTVEEVAQTDGNGQAPHAFSTARRYSLLLIFCLAQFLDSFNNSFMFCAIPTMIVDLHIAEGESTWILSAFQLTFAAFLLIVSAPVAAVEFVSASLT